MSKGWIKLHRSTFDNDLWTAEPFTKGQAWVDLIGHANHRPASIWIRGIEVTVDRGQLAWSELTMEGRWKWSRGKVRRYLRMLQDRGMIEQQKTKLTTIITVCKYEVYQAEQPTERTTGDTTGETTGETTDGQQTDNRRYTNKNVKNEENGKKTDKPPRSPKGDDVNYDSWPCLPEPQTLKDWLKARKKAKGAHTQTAIDRIGKELHKAVAMGYTVEDCISLAATKTWRGFEAEWMNNAKGRSAGPAGQQGNYSGDGWAEGFDPAAGDFDDLIGN